MKTQLQIARLLDVDKTTIYRVCRDNGIEATETGKNGVRLYDDDTVALISGLVGDQTAKKEAQRQKKGVEALQYRCEALQKSVADYEKTVAEHVKTIAEVRADRDGWRDQAEHLRTNNERLTAEIERLRAENAALRLPWWRRRKALLALPEKTFKEEDQQL